MQHLVLWFSSNVSVGQSKVGLGDLEGFFHPNDSWILTRT